MGREIKHLKPYNRNGVRQQMEGALRREVGDKIFANAAAHRIVDIFEVMTASNDPVQVVIRPNEDGTYAHEEVQQAMRGLAEHIAYENWEKILKALLMSEIHRGLDDDEPVQAPPKASKTLNSNLEK